MDRFFEVFTDKKGQYRWRLRAFNNKIIADSAKSYKKKSDCIHGMELLKLPKKDKTGKFAIDEQTGKGYEIVPEAGWSIVAATFSILYLIAMLVFFCWLLLDIFIGRNLLLCLISLKADDYMKSPILQLIAYSVIGGGMGGVINGIRSFIMWHAERRAFGWRFMWKYITLPLVGVILAAIVYTIIRGGVAAFGGSFAPPTENFTTQAFWAFAIGALTGYGSHKAFKWLDIQVNKVFRITPVTEIEVPDLKGKTQKEAEDILKEFNLIRGKVDQKVSDDSDDIDKVIDQNPQAGLMISKGGSVDIVIGTKA